MPRRASAYLLQFKKELTGVMKIGGELTGINDWFVSELLKMKGKAKGVRSFRLLAIG